MVANSRFRALCHDVTVLSQVPVLASLTPEMHHHLFFEHNYVNVPL